MGSRRLLVAFGTQTGCAREVAERIGREATRARFRPKVVGLDEYDVTKLPGEKLVAFVVSTTGQGDVPDNMKAFWRFLLRKGLGNESLSGVSFAVFGLGDSSYVKFNFVGKRLYRRLIQLGAQPLLRRGDGDDQHPMGLDGELDPWLRDLWQVLLQKYPLPLGLSPIDPSVLLPPRVSLKLRKRSEIEGFQETSPPSSSTPESQVLARCSISYGSSSWNLARPYPAKLLENRRITSSDCEQDVRHLEFDLGESGITYLPGDVVYIHPRNPTSTVEAFLTFLGLDPNHVIEELQLVQDQGEEEEEESSGAETGTSRLFPGVRLPISLRELFVHHVDVLGTPKRYFFELLSSFATAEHEVEKLKFFASSEGQEELRFYCVKEHRTYFEVLQDFPSAKPSLAYLLEMIPALTPRAFSISSSLRAHPNRIHVTMLVVQYKTPLKRVRKGLCSSWLASLDPMSPETPRVPVWVKQGSLRLPSDPSTPLIMVGPGTGLAIFRSFIQERHAVLHQPQGESDATVTTSRMSFFFGCRKRAQDYHYGDEFEARKADGTLELFEVAFSRDQPQKVYVQHKIRERRKEVWATLQAGGYMYISGSASQMPNDVRKAVVEIARSEGGLSEEEAENFVKRLELTARFATETWQ